MNMAVTSYEDLFNVYLISGDTFRRIEERAEISFDSVIKHDSITGSSSFGFSGNGNIYKFSFLSGKILDPNDNFVFSYQEDKPIKISGNLNDTQHSYHINSVPFQFSGSKNSFNIQRFFADADNTRMNLDMSVFAHGSGALSVSFDEPIDDGKIVDMTITNTGSGISFDVFTGFFHYPHDRQITILNFPQGVSTTSKFQVSGSGSFPIDFSPSLTLYTTFGKAFVSGIEGSRGEGIQSVTLNSSFNNQEPFGFTLFGGEGL